mmetsp:Transcript_63973/g.198579  ORF Transcript_63973/g.198579 Transcript_63973/m.198579 type:complete len:218 (-) Transcript_63973:155-808(-)
MKAVPLAVRAKFGRWLLRPLPVLLALLAFRGHDSSAPKRARGGLRPEPEPLARRSGQRLATELADAMFVGGGSGAHCAAVVAAGTLGFRAGATAGVINGVLASLLEGGTPDFRALMRRLVVCCHGCGVAEDGPQLLTLIWQIHHPQAPHTLVCQVGLRPRLVGGLGVAQLGEHVELVHLFGADAPTKGSINVLCLGRWWGVFGHGISGCCGGLVERR